MAWVVTTSTGGLIFGPLEVPFPHMSEEQFLSELAEIPDDRLRTLATLLWKDLENVRADIDRIAEIERALRDGAVAEIRRRDVMIQKVIDLHTPDSTAPEICRECLDLLPCPTLRALEES